MHVRRRALATICAVVLLLTALTLGASPASALPPPPPNPTDQELGAASATQQAAAAEVGRLAGLVAEAQVQLEQTQVRAEAAGIAYEAALEQLQIAQEAADQAAAELQDAVDAVTVSRAQIAAFSRESYVNGGSLTDTAVLLDADGPGQLLEQAAMLAYVADTRVDVLEVLEVAQLRQANADAAARATRDAMAAAEDAAEAAKVEADAQVAAQQAVYAEVGAQKAAYEQQLQDAQVALLTLQGARDAYGQWVAQKEAEEQAARLAAAADQRRTARAASSPSSSGYVKPASGRVSSCYGARWGVTHFGVDIAAPIGTPVYAATSGVVARAGAATGFGQAVYVRGSDGAVTVYGHVNRYFVSVGERVSAGEEIAEVGNRGQSTGPHLHFEVHPGGSMYSGAVDPVPWMNARGITLGGCGG